MGEVTRRVVVFPRYSSLVNMGAGSVSFHAAPIGAREFSKVSSFTEFAKYSSDPGATVNYTLQASPDLVTWLDLAPILDPEDLVDFPVDGEWLRVKVAVAQNRVTGCMTLEFTLRGA